MLDAMLIVPESFADEGQFPRSLSASITTKTIIFSVVDAARRLVDRKRFSILQPANITNWPKTLGEFAGRPSRGRLVNSVTRYGPAS
jgi:hypothetical protein